MSWLKLDDQIFYNRKVAQCDIETKMLYIVGLTYCAHQLTDGFIPAGTLPLLAGMAGIDWQIAKQNVGKLLDICLWIATPEGWQIPDYLEYNPSREQVLHNRDVRSEAGKLGGVAKSQQNAKQSPGKSLPPSPSPSPIEYVPIIPQETPKGDAEDGAPAALVVGSRSFQEWHDLLQAAPNKAATALDMFAALYPQAVDVPDFGRIGATAKKVGGWGRLAELLWQHSARPPSGDVLSYIEAAIKTNGKSNSKTPAKTAAGAKSYEELKSAYVPKGWEDIIEH